jgi:hypothetical protein
MVATAILIAMVIKLAVDFDGSRRKVLFGFAIFIFLSASFLQYKHFEMSNKLDDLKVQFRQSEHKKEGQILEKKEELLHRMGYLEIGYWVHEDEHIDIHSYYHYVGMSLADLHIKYIDIRLKRFLKKMNDKMTDHNRLKKVYFD